MELEQAEQLQQLTQRAHTLLFANSWTVRLGVQPAFDNSSVVGVLSDKPGVIVARTWRRHEDARKFATPVERLKHPANLQPTVIQMNVDDSQGVATAALRCLAEIRLPVLPESRRAILDGTRHSVLVNDANTAINLSWSNQGPEEWHMVSQWFDQTWAAFCGVLQFDPINQEPASGL